MDDTEHLGGFANLSAEWLAAECFVSLRTARRWRATGRAPRLAVAWLRLKHWGELGTIHAAWRDWTLHHDGKLYDQQQGRWYTPVDLTAHHLRMQETAGLWVELRQLRAELTAARSLAATLAARALGGATALGESTGLGSAFHRLDPITASMRNATAAQAMTT